VGIVKREMDKPTHNYNSDVNSAWTMYNHITLALKESHPSSFMKDHQRVHGYFVDAFGNLVQNTVDDTVQDTVHDEDVYEEVTADPVSPSFNFDSYGVNFL
jgi:hypothetical protein